MPNSGEPSDDPFLDEIHALKRAHSARFGNDIDAMVKYAQSLTKQLQRRKSRANKAPAAPRAKRTSKKKTAA